MANVPGNSNAHILTDLFIELDYTKAPEGATLGEICEMVKLERSTMSPDDVNAQVYDLFIQGVNNADSSVRNMKLVNQTCNSPGYEDVHAAAFVSESGEAIVSFRGTGNGRWVDNAIGLGPEDSPIQRQSAEYFDMLCEKYDFANNVTVSGHSKGGNLAQYITMVSENRGRITDCISYDGEGFSPEALERFRNMPGYEEQLDKVTRICGNNDPVSQLGIPLVKEEDTIYVTLPDADVTTVPPGLPEGHYFHNMLQVDEYGRVVLNEVDPNGPGEVALFYRGLSDYVMSLPPDERLKVARGIMIAAETAIGNPDLSTEDFSVLETLGAVPETISALLYSKVRNASDAELMCYAIEVIVLCVVGIKALPILILIDVGKVLVSALITVLNDITAEDIIKGFMKFCKDAEEFVSRVGEKLKYGLNRGYRYALANTELMIDTQAFRDCGVRLEGLYERVDGVNNLLRKILCDISLPIVEYNYMQSASWYFKSSGKLKSCASYLFHTAEAFEAVENKFK